MIHEQKYAFGILYRTTTVDFNPVDDDIAMLRVNFRIVSFPWPPVSGWFFLSFHSQSFYLETKENNKQYTLTSKLDVPCLQQ